ncbi:MULTISPECIES: hypothetical protein [unclassified Sphingopyxis]|uniref:hypothetical protein n=1 Tax=unclassified Sphingopyxis TaxID=2614943 RepID=UPI00285ED06F|nr:MULTISPECIES: hypothetical protein [unclassified Sphingopyxis]MDR7061980.1 hypothetical protein [Sphingopyxis sp. BE235]MDR7182439.1 hypothetical protein [Sphingopyxis sp. BE249]
MRATITVYGEQGSGKTRWLEQLKRTLLATAPAEAVEVTVHESNKSAGAMIARQFDEFTIPAADADGTASPAGDRETWSVYWSPNGKYHVYAGATLIARFERQSDAELFKKMKCTTSGQWQALGAVLDRKSFNFNGERPLFTGGPLSENRKGGGGEIAEGAGAIPPGVYWHEAAGNFISWWTDAPLKATFYRAWASRRAEFPQSRHEAGTRTMFANSSFGKLSAAEAPAIHDAVNHGVSARFADQYIMAKVACGLRQVATDITTETHSTTWPTYRKNHYFAYADRVNGFAAELEADKPTIAEWPTPMVPRAERDALIEKYAAVSDKYSEAVDRIQELLSAHQVYRRDAVELRQERDEARRERDSLKERFANVRAFLNGFKDLSDALRDAADIARAS